MSHKRKIIDKKLWEESKDDAYKILFGATKSAKGYFLRMIAFTIILYTLTFIMYRLAGWNWFTEVFLVIPITTTVFLSHEALHLAVVRYFGYKIEWYPVNLVTILNHTFQMQGFDVLFPTKQAQLKHTKLIGIAPYIIIFPLCLIFVLTPYLTLQISGVILAFTHFFSMFYEAKQC